MKTDISYRKACDFSKSRGAGFFFKERIRDIKKKQMFPRTSVFSAFEIIRRFSFLKNRVVVSFQFLSLLFNRV